MAPAPRTRTGPAAGGATFAFPGDPSSRPPRVLKWWVGRPPSPSFSPWSRPPPQPPLPEPARPRGAAAPPSVPARAPRGSGARPAPLPGIRQRRSREYSNASPGNMATPPPAAALTCAGLTSRGRGRQCPPRRPSAAASPPPCAGPQFQTSCDSAVTVSLSGLDTALVCFASGVHLTHQPRSLDQLRTQRQLGVQGKVLDCPRLYRITGSQAGLHPRSSNKYKSLCKSEAEPSCCSKLLPSPCCLSHPFAVSLYKSWRWRAPSWMCDSVVPPHGKLFLMLIPDCIQFVFWKGCVE
ncbi:actin nucleation-promoting factor WASL-like [Vidua chalybeata]|uniref:actin nucleation-promoting factor WASL-like n=1 Tax=Vidua chalybeata TaxID=81927 RepID=UPI0023A7A0E2|nr:actin nucleation-promoting factor WASL-like [Vidua chalybeata]XP_053798745.1 actin nucleation-promoting factor WASL-like [Vidua chalybeata]XP_053798746.1 actin nucleation-promoting factor WASL-like [Vidua chalybeata]